MTRAGVLVCQSHVAGIAIPAKAGIAIPATAVAVAGIATPAQRCDTFDTLLDINGLIGLLAKCQLTSQQVTGDHEQCSFCSFIHFNLTYW